MISRRERLTWALVFSVPPGVGIAIATALVSGDPITTPLAMGAFVVTTIGLFALVYGAATINQGDPANGSTLDEGDARDLETRDADASEADARDAGASEADARDAGASDDGDSAEDAESSDADA